MTVGFLKNLLIVSGEILKQGFGSISNYQTKQDQSNIVTEYDLKSENRITGLIQQSYPDHNILGEENGFINKDSEYSWIIDPLDGTSNYTAQIPWFGILIALLKNNEPILSGAYLPVSNDLYYAILGGGAFKNDQPIHAGNEVDLKNILCCYSLDFSKDQSKTEYEVQIIKKLVQNCRNLRSTNSLVDFCFTAEGKFGAAINQTMKIWDIAALHLILEEAGAKVTDIHGNQIIYDLSDQSISQNFTAITANPTIHEKICILINN
ncbi:MAG: inositol monophosphatase [Cyclobacteriaceae bacterium]|nr:inositol monophosphatase [Cyclobacteriaceae bacterium]